MREDMFKVIVERPRRGRSWAKKTKLRYLKEDDGRSRVSGKRIAAEGGRRKWLNENLAPLKRYLFKQRGRKWDDVFSEICQQLDTGSTVKMHVREHVDDFVTRHVRVDDNGMYWGVPHWGELRKPDQWRSDLYVCPIDGRLKETAKLCQKLGLMKQRHNYRYFNEDYIETDQLIQLSSVCFLVAIKGIWFELTTDKEPRCQNLALFKVFQKAPHIGYYDWQILTKKQLSKKELKKHGLKNTPIDGGDDV